MKKLLILASILLAGDGLSQALQSPLGSQNLPAQSGPMRNNNSPFGHDPLSDNDPLSGRVQEQQARSRNSERQKRLVEDTDKLVNIANRLKEQVQKPGEPLDPADVERKADEIEKLAKSVKDKMKG